MTASNAVSDAGLSEQAWAVDTRAEDRLREVDPDGVAEALASLPTTATSQAARRARLRSLARKHHPEVAALYAQADALYWQIVTRNDGFLRQQAHHHAKLSRADLDDVLTAIRESAFVAAVNWRPEQAKYTTAAMWQIRSGWQRANERQGAVDIGDSRAIRAAGGFGRADVASLDAPLGDDPDGATMLDMLGETDPDTDAADLAKLMEAMDTLDERSRDVVRRWSEGETLGVIADAHGISKERARQIHAAAVGALRAELESRRHRAKIKAGVDAAKAAGTHCGRPATFVPPAAVEAVRGGEPIKAVAKRHGVDHNTLRRRVKAAEEASERPAPPVEIQPDPVDAPQVEPAPAPAAVAVALPSLDDLDAYAREVAEIAKLRKWADRTRERLRAADEEIARRWAALRGAP